MGVYEPLSSGVIVAPYRSHHRHELLRIMSWYDVIAGILTLIVLTLTVAPLVRYSPWFVIWPLGYAAYVLVKVPVARNAQHISWLQSAARDVITAPVAGMLKRAGMMRFLDTSIGDLLPQIHLVLATVVVGAVFAFSGSVLTTDIHLGIPLRDTDTLWLLFVPPILRFARFGRPRWVMLMVAAAILGNAFVHKSDPLTFWRWLQMVGIQSCWLIMICLLPALLSRYLAERKEGLNAAVAVGSEIARLRTSSQTEFANQAALVIAKRLGYDEVNVLVPTSEDEAVGKRLRFLGAASEAGRALVDEKYVLEHATGVNGWTAVHLCEQVVNDVRHDTRELYYPHPSFPYTQSELSMPLLLGDKLLGVLDVQSTQRNAFSEDDLETLRVIVPHLAVALDNAQNLAHAEGLSTILQTIAQRLLSHHELEHVLEEAVHVARDVLQADTVVLYPHNPRSGEVTEPIVEGHVDTYVAPAADMMEPESDSVVQRVLKLGTPQFTNHADQDSPLAASPDAESSRQIPSFIHREQIRASAALPLRIGVNDGDAVDAETASFGVLFINYRRERLFTQDYQQWCIALADLMALAIQNAWLHKRVANEERANQWREIHDGMAQYAGMTRMLLEQAGAEIERAGTLSSDGTAKVLTARDGIQQLQRQVNYLVEIWRDRDPEARSRDGGYEASYSTEKSFATDLRNYADIVRRTMEVRCECTCLGDDARIPAVVHHEALMIIREAVHNALRHGKASSLGIGARVAEHTLELRVSDNGKGFVVETVAFARGLGNIRHRAKKRGGAVRIESTPGDGTTLYVALPF